MNEEVVKETKHAISIMRAFLRGKKIQVYASDGWKDIDEPRWNFMSRSYRLALRPYSYEELKQLIGKTILFNNNKKDPYKVIGVKEKTEYNDGFVVCDNGKSYSTEWLYRDFFYNGKRIAKRLEP